MNTPTPQNTCRQCGGPMASNAPEGLCARCLLSVAMKEPEPSGKSDQSDRSDESDAARAANLPHSDIPDIADAAEVARRLPQFEILELLGRGGMGVVYKARQLNLDRIVALKILPPTDALTPDFIERFRREARSLAKLSHTNIVAVYDFGESGGLYYFVMEFVDGVNLRAMIRAGKMKPEEALAVVPKICDALQFAHEEGVVHRDIKPENILIDKRGRVKIADFGLAKLLRREQTDNTLTMSGMTLGTPRYMAPEQMDKPETVDHRADIYSLGVVFYEMLTGEVPMGRFAPPSERVRIDVRLDEIVLHALERDADRRYQHASQVRDDVEKVTSKPHVASFSSPAPPTPVASGVVSDGGEIEPSRLGPLPRLFWAGSFVALLLGWVAVGALWKHGLTGLVLSAAVMGGIALEICVFLAKQDPRWVENWKAASTWKRFNVLCYIIPFAMVFMMVIGGMFSLTRSSSTHHVNRFSQSPEEFEAKYKGKEYQLIRELDAFKVQVPAVELSREGSFTFGMREGATDPFAALVWISGGLIALLWVFQQGMGGDAFLTWTIRRGDWRRALICTGAVLASATLAYPELKMVTLMAHFHKGPYTVTTVNKTVALHATVKQAADALDRWVVENGYKVDSLYRWRLDTVPKGECVARVEVSDAWDDEPFDPLRLTSTGPQPVLRFQIIGSEKPVQSKVRVISKDVEVGSENEKRWQGIVKTLTDALNKAADLDASKPIVKPAVKKIETESYWPGLCGVLAAMLLWVFVRARYFMPVPASGIKPGAEKAASEPQSSPLSQAEEAVRRARTSWFGRRSERFRTLLPPALIFLQLVLLLASFAPGLSPWGSWTRTYTPHKHGVADPAGSFAFHPFTLSFCLFVASSACPLLSRWFSRIDNLVRHGRRFRELQKDILRQAKLKIFGCQAVAIFAPILIAVLFVTMAPGGLNGTAVVNYTEFRLGPNSKAYEELLIDTPFYFHIENGVKHYRRPNQWDMAIGLKTKDGAEPVTMDIEMPSLHASYAPSWSKDHEMPIVLDLDELTKWMSDRGKLEVKDDKVKKEATELMALLKRFTHQAPANEDEYLDAEAELLPDFWHTGMRGWPGNTGSYSQMNGDWLMWIYLASAVIFLALYLVVAPRFQRAAFALDREVRERGESVLARGPLPRVKFGALPRDIRVRMIRRAVLIALGLLLLPGVLALMEPAQPKRVKETYYYGFAPMPTFEKNDTGNGAQIAKPSPLLKHFQEVIMTFAFESYERDGEKWFVQPRPFQLELTFCRPKNFSEKPGEFHEVIQPGKGVPEGEAFSFIVELPGLHAKMDSMASVSSVTLDEEELLRWMEQTIATTAVRPTGSSSSWGFQKPDGTKATLYSLPMSETPELKSFAADLMAFLKKYATSAPTTHDAFMAAARKIPSLNGHSATTTFHAEGSGGVAILPALAAVIVIFLALLPLLKRAAVRTAMRQGMLDIALPTPAPAEGTKPAGPKASASPPDHL